MWVAMWRQRQSTSELSSPALLEWSKLHSQHTASACLSVVLHSRDYLAFPLYNTFCAHTASALIRRLSTVHILLRKQSYFKRTCFTLECKLPTLTYISTETSAFLNKCFRAISSPLLMAIRVSAIFSDKLNLESSNNFAPAPQVFMLLCSTSLLERFPINTYSFCKFINWGLFFNI